MAHVNITKDLTEVKSKVVFGLTRRQLIFFVLAALVAAPTYFLTRDSLGNDIALILLIVTALPFFFFALYVVDLEYLAKVDADHIIFTSNDGTLGELADNPVWQNLKAVKNGNVYLGDNETQYNLSYTSQGKLIYMEMLADAIKEHRNIE